MFLVVYFTIPALTGWPYAGASPEALIAYAKAHELLFYAGGWLQATGALLSIVFFLALLQLAGCWGRLAGSLTLVGGALLLAVVVLEAVFLEAVPAAAEAGDSATVATTFALSNGVFARIFPLAPAPLLFMGAAMMLASSHVLPRFFATSAFAVAGLFLLSGIAAIFSSLGLIFAIVMSIVEAIWIGSAGVALLVIRPNSADDSGE